MKKLEFLKANLIDVTSGKCFKFKDSVAPIISKNKNLPATNAIPIVIDEVKSVFSVEDILKNAPTTQDKSYRNSSLKNKMRKSILPQLSKDFNLEKRYKTLAQRVEGKTILIIGAGDKIEYYNRLFSKSLVITSDVHLQFSPDVVFDAHQIPFKDSVFSLIIAAQVLEHTFKPWQVAKEMERCVINGGLLLVETPFNFPYHSPPYDFFRFTFTGLRSLFSKCALEHHEVSEGSASALAVFCSQFLIDISANRYIRMVMVFISRFLFGWIKYLDVFKSKTKYRNIVAPMGFSMLFKKDTINRTQKVLLEEFFKLKSNL